MKTKRKITLVPSLLLLCAFIGQVNAQTLRAWATNGAGTYTWSDSANWTGSVPDTNAEIASFANNSTSGLLMSGTYVLNVSTPITIAGIGGYSGGTGTSNATVQIGGSAITLINGTGGSAASIRLDGNYPRLLISSNLVNTGTAGLSLSANSSFFVINGSITGNKVSKTGSGFVYLGGSNSWSGGTNLDGGYLIATATSAFGFTGTFNVGTGSAVAGIGTLASGTTTIANALVFNTTNTINLQSGGTGSTLEFSTSSITDASGGALAIARAAGNAAYGIADPTGTGIVKFSGTNLSLARNITVTAGSDLELAPSSGTQTFTGNLSAGSKLIKSSNGTVAYQGNITAAVIEVNGGTLNLSGTNTYVGATTVSNGTLLVSGGAINNTSSVAISGSASKFQYLSSTALNRSVTVTSGATFSYGSSSNFAGTFTFTNGKLGGTNWNGNLNNLTIGANQTISPGNSPGTASTTTQTWASLGAYDWEINKVAGAAGSDPGWDLLNLGGALNITATSGSKFTINVVSLTLGNAAGNVADFDSAATYYWLLADAGSAITSFSADKFALNLAQFSNSYAGTWGIYRGDAAGVGGDSSQIYIGYTVPEPSTYLLLVSAGGILILLRPALRRSV